MTLLNQYIISENNYLKTIGLNKLLYNARDISEFDNILEFYGHQKYKKWLLFRKAILNGNIILTNRKEFWSMNDIDEFIFEKIFTSNSLSKRIKKYFALNSPNVKIINSKIFKFRNFFGIIKKTNITDLL